MASGICMVFWLLAESLNNFCCACSCIDPTTSLFKYTSFAIASLDERDKNSINKNPSQYDPLKKHHQTLQLNSLLEQCLLSPSTLSMSQEIKVSNISVSLIGKNESQRRLIRMMVIEASAWHRQLCIEPQETWALALLLKLCSSHIATLNKKNHPFLPSFASWDNQIIYVL